ncbi:MAG: BrnA antitoxin family protein [Vicinamibacterales bacterium]
MKKEYDFSKGRRGPVIRQRGKTRITIHLDDDVLEAFRERADAEGRGYQTMINEALREHLGQSGNRVDADTIRRIVREELRKTG